jgi:hypothetical protein
MAMPRTKSSSIARLAFAGPVPPNSFMLFSPFSVLSAALSCLHHGWREAGMSAKIKAFSDNIGQLACVLQA